MQDFCCVFVFLWYFCVCYICLFVSHWPAKPEGRSLRRRLRFPLLQTSYARSWEIVFKDFSFSNLSFNCLWKPPLVVFEHAGSWSGFELEGQKAAQRRISCSQQSCSFSFSFNWSCWIWSRCCWSLKSLSPPILPPSQLLPPLSSPLSLFSLPPLLLLMLSVYWTHLPLSTSLHWIQISAVASASFTGCCRLRGSFAGRLRRRATIRTASSSRLAVEYSCAVFCHTTAQTTQAPTTAAASKDTSFQIKPRKTSQKYLVHLIKNRQQHIWLFNWPKSPLSASALLLLSCHSRFTLNLKIRQNGLKTGLFGEHCFQKLTERNGFGPEIAS